MTIQPCLCQTWTETPKTGFLRVVTQFSYEETIQEERFREAFLQDCPITFPDDLETERVLTGDIHFITRVLGLIGLQIKGLRNFVSVCGVSIIQLQTEGVTVMLVKLHNDAKLIHSLTCFKRPYIPVTWKLL